MYPDYSSPELAVLHDRTVQLDTLRTTLFFAVVETKRELAAFKADLARIPADQPFVQSVLRPIIRTVSDLVRQLSLLQAKAHQLWAEAVTDRQVLCDQLRRAWEATHPDEANALLAQALRRRDHESRDRRTVKRHLIKRAVSA